MSSRKRGSDNEQPPVFGRVHDSPVVRLIEPASAGPAAVVGASGFIGTALVRRLELLGVPVQSFTRDVPFTVGSRRLAPGPESVRTVFWLAASVNPAVAEARPDLIGLDQAALADALEALETSVHPPLVVLVSSGGTVYDASAAPPYSEDSAVSGSTAYARSKLALERALQSSALPKTCKVVLRVANAYGPGQAARRGLGVVAHWLASAAGGGPLVLIGDKNTVRDFVYIDDIVDALVAVHRADGALPPVLNIGSGHGTTLGQLADTVLEVVDDPTVAVEVRPARSFDLSRTWLDTSFASRVLGWQAKTSLHDGVVAAWRALRGDTAADQARG